jgi:hypothetical protein
MGKILSNTEGTGRGFDGEPKRTACTEIVGNDTVIPNEFFAEHGEFDEMEPDNGMDTGIFENDPHDTCVHHQELENLSEEDFYPDRHDCSEEEREANRDSEWDPNRVAQAGANLMTQLNLTPTREMCNVIAAYMGRLEHRMDGAIHHCLDNRHNQAVVEAAVEFAGKMNKYLPEISKQARDRLVADAQMEQQLQRRLDGPANKLGQAIFGKDWSRWSRLLRATV